MEGCRFCSLHSSSALTTTTVPCSLPPRNVGFSEKPLFLQGQVLKFPSNSKVTHKCSTKFRFLNIRAQASETPKKESSKDRSLAFVAGATGKVGSRAVRELLKLGFRVRAGVRSPEKAQALVQSVKAMNVVGDSQPVEKLEIVQCDLEKKYQIGEALGNASVVLCCIGASEKEVFDISGPFRIDYLATKNLIEAANVANVEHFILLTSLGTNKVGFPAAILNLFWGVLIWKRKAEEALIASGLPYTIVRPGGMERPTDAYKETHNITLSLEDTLFGGQVSNLQVAELMACMAKNRGLSYCKVVEVIAETTAPLTPMEDLLKKIPSKRAGGFPPEEEKVPDLAPSVSEEPKSSAAEEPVIVKEIAPRPSSPYIAYEDLKPPTSPSPTPSTTAGAAKESVVTDGPVVPSPTPSLEVSEAIVQEEVVKTEVKKITPSSPFIAYEDLKPPSSPSPTPSGLQKPPTSPTLTPSTTDGAAKASVVSPGPEAPSPKPSQEAPKAILQEEVEKTEVQKITPSSPFTAYEDLKPPSSPSPTPSGLQKAPPVASSAVDVAPPSPGGNDAASLTIDAAAENGSPQISTYCLSPYSAYEDLKPPSSPCPSPPSTSKS